MDLMWIESCPEEQDLGVLADKKLNTELFTTRVGRHWDRLPRAVVAAPSLEVFKARSDGALNSLVWWKVSLPMAGALELNDL